MVTPRNNTTANWFYGELPHRQDYTIILVTQLCVARVNRTLNTILNLSLSLTLPLDLKFKIGGVRVDILPTLPDNPQGFLVATNQASPGRLPNCAT